MITREEYNKALESKVKDCKNTNTIFDTRKYVLLEDAKEVLSQALNISDVASSLPSKEEMEIGLETLLEYKLKDKSEYDKITFKFGFRTCYLWLANRGKK